MGEPWWNSRAIRYFHNRVLPGGRVFEWGSGGSTVWFVNRGMEVTSVESEREWAERVRARCRAHATVILIPGQQHGSMRSEPLGPDRGVHFFDEYVRAIENYPDSYFDAAVIDGRCRFECARLARSKVKPGGLVVLDDSQTSSYAGCLALFKGWSTERIAGFRRRDLFVRETAFFERP